MLPCCECCALVQLPSVPLGCAVPGQEEQGPAGEGCGAPGTSASSCDPSQPEDTLSMFWLRLPQLLSVFAGFLVPPVPRGGGNATQWVLRCAGPGHGVRSVSPGPSRGQSLPLRRLSRAVRPPRSLPPAPRWPRPSRGSAHALGAGRVSSGRCARARERSRALPRRRAEWRELPARVRGLTRSGGRGVRPQGRLGRRVVRHDVASP